MVALGVLMGLLLALASTVRVGVAGNGLKLTSRTPVEWVSTSTMAVTQAGFPEGRAILDDTLKLAAPGPDGETRVPRFSDPTRYSALASYYVELAKSDAVRRTVMQGAAPGTKYEANVVKSADGSSVLNVLVMAGYAHSAKSAEAIANRALLALRSYIALEQSRNKVPEDERVELNVMSRASEAEVFQGRSLVRPVFLFLLPVLLTLGLAFVLENLRPGTNRGPTVHQMAARDEPTAAREEPHPERAQRSA